MTFFSRLLFSTGCGRSCVSLGQKLLEPFKQHDTEARHCHSAEITLRPGRHHSRALFTAGSCLEKRQQQRVDGAAAGGALTASSESGSAALPSSCLTLAQPVYTAGFKLLPQLRQPQSPLLAHVLLDTGSASLPQGNRKNSLLAAEEEVRRAWANKSAAPSVN